MKSNVNVFIGVVLCAVLCGTFVWLRSAGEEDTWKPNEIYDQVHSSSYSASYTNATFSGSPQDGGVALSMSSSSLSRKANFYAGAHTGIATMPLASSPLASSPMGAASSAGLYTTSSAELKSFGGGGNGGAAMGGAARGNSVSSASLQGGAGIGFVSSPIAYSTARRGDISSTSGVNPAMMAQQGVTPDMASAGNFGYAAASSYMNAGVNDQYNAINGSSNGRSNVRGRQNALGFNDSWWKWFDTWVHSNSNGDGYYDETEGSEGYYFNRYSLQKAYDDFCKYFWNSGMGVPPSFDEWLDWYQSAMGENGYYYAYSESRYYWVPLGDILPLILLALLHLVVMYFRTKFRTRVND